MATKAQKPVLKLQDVLFVPAINRKCVVTKIEKSGVTFTNKNGSRKLDLDAVERLVF